MTTPARARGALALGLVGFAAVRLRGQCEPYVALHRWLRDAGVPDAVRNLDGFALTALLAFATAAIAGGWRRALSEQTDWPAHAGEWAAKQGGAVDADCDGQPSHRLRAHSVASHAAGTTTIPAAQRGPACA